MLVNTIKQTWKTTLKSIAHTIICQFAISKRISGDYTYLQDNLSLGETWVAWTGVVNIIPFS